jgi:hypothetical protein
LHDHKTKLLQKQLWKHGRRKKNSSDLLRMRQSLNMAWIKTRERNVPTGEKNEKMKVETKRDFHPFEGWKEILSL